MGCPSRLPAAAADEAEQRQDQDHDQDDVEQVHALSFV
jgi:hypothetical protein